MPEDIECGGDGLHFSLDAGNCQTPPGAFHDKDATNTIRKNDPKWMDTETGG